MSVMLSKEQYPPLMTTTHHHLVRGTEDIGLGMGHYI